MDGPGGPSIDMKMALSGGCTLQERGRRTAAHTLDPVRSFLSLTGNARFKPICVAPSCEVAGLAARDGV